jgi:hypothetical protein
LDSVFQDFAGDRDRACGLRKQVADSIPPKMDVLGASNLDIPIAAEERPALDDILNSFNEYDLTKNQAQKVSNKLAALMFINEQ